MTIIAETRSVQVEHADLVGAIRAGHARLACGEAALAALMKQEPAEAAQALAA